MNEEAEHPSPRAADPLVAELYDELRRIAHRHLTRERPDHTLTTTALVHEAYLRVMKTEGPAAEDRSQFLALTATAMRRVLVDYARARTATKRGGAQRQVPLTDAMRVLEEESERLVAIDDALGRLKESSPRLVQLVECRFFAGLSEEETGKALGISERSVRREWVKAKGWLAAALA